MVATADRVDGAAPWRERARRRGIKWSAHPEDVIPAWVADMDFAVAPAIRAFIAASAEGSDLGYPPYQDRDPLPEVFAARTERLYGWRPDPGRVELLSDIVQGIYIALETYTRQQDGVLIQTPIYPPFLAAVDDLARRGVLEALLPGAERYEIDLERLRSAAAGARVLMLCNPHNPTGRVFGRDELERIAEIAIEHDLVVLSDEIHADLIYPGHRHIPFASLGPEVEARTVTFASATKAFNTAGIRCAVVAFGSDDLQRRFDAIPRRIRGGLGIFATEVTRIAWTECDDWLAETLAALDANRAHLGERLAAEMPAVRWWSPEATYLAWLDCRALGLGEHPARHFLERARVALQDGVQFGEVGRGWVRLNYATDRATLDAIIDRMRDSLG